MPGKRPVEPNAPARPGEPTDEKTPAEREPAPDVTPLDEDEHIKDGIEVDET